MRARRRVARSAAPPQPEQNPASSIREKAGKALACARQRAYPEALGLYAEILAESPSHRPAMVATAQLLTRLGRWPDAAAAWERAADAFPTELKYRIQQARALMKAGNERDALIEYYEVLAVAPENAEALKSIATISARLKRWGAVAKVLAELARMEPGDLGLRLRLARAHYSRGDNEKAAQTFRAVLQGEPDHREALVGLGRCLTRQKDWAKAHAVWGKLHERDPSETEPRLQLVRAFKALGKDEKARELLEPILAADPKNKAALALRGQP